MWGGAFGPMGSSMPTAKRCAQHPVSRAVRVGEQIGVLD